MTYQEIAFTVAYDDVPFDPLLETSHGFSCLIETRGKTILFDTGGDGHLLLENLRKLNKDPGHVDILVLSHQHWDHSGGVFTLLRSTGPVAVYMPKAFPASFASHAERLGADVTIVDGPIEIVPGIHSTGQMGGDELVKGRREQSLVFDTAAGTVVLTGCAHPGIVNIVQRAREIRPGEIAYALGGFHLKDTDDPAVIGVIGELKALGVRKMAASHCTGTRQIEMFRDVWDMDFIPFGCGATLRLPLRP
jgi:7,8-dihydropterin-6-yl-methyl-4-(beta-D-ribofuranosyl)aminobenzene 5'-phosphate synthase